jgi:CTP:molybdopterin cytidylyltransferase MocA
VSRLAAVVLAAGRSSRMGELKPLLPLGGGTVLARAVAAFREVGVDDVRVVVGWRADDVAAAAAELGVPTVLNPDWRRGMFSSVAGGVASLGAGAERFFVLPADCALVRPETVGRLARTALASTAPVIYPVHGGLRGHPPLIARAALPADLGREPLGGLGRLLGAHDAAALEVATGDPGVLLDLDEPGDYRRACEEVVLETLPDERRCLALLDEAGAPRAVVEHSRVVAAVAIALTRRLNEHGLCLHEGLVAAGALLHDIARLQDDHPRVGAERLRELGYRRLAPLVARHIDLDVQVEGENDGIEAGDGAAGLPDELRVLYLADKLVRDATVIDLDERRAARLRQFEGQPDAQAGVRRRFGAAREIAGVVERLTGEPAVTIARRALWDGRGG